MKIAHFILSMSIGGGERLVRTLSQRLRIPGYSNRVICFDRIDEYREEFFHAGVPLTLIPRRQCFFDWKIVPALVRRIRKEKIRLIHAHDLSALTYAVVAGRVCGARVVMTEHSRHYVEAAWKRRLEKWLFVMASDRLIEVSPVLREASVHRDRIVSGKIDVVENGVPIERFQGAKPARLRAALAIPEGSPILLTVGRLETIKGQQHLIRAMAEPALANLPVHLLLAGNGSQRVPLGKLARDSGLGDRVHFLGPRQDIPEVMAAADFLVIPSESEGLPFTLLEGMAAELPIISAAVGRIPGILGNDLRGILVPPKCPEALALGIRRALDNPRKIQSMVCSASQFVVQNYGEEAMLSRYRGIYESLLFPPDTPSDFPEKTSRLNVG